MPSGEFVGRPITSIFIKFAMRPKNNPTGATTDSASKILNELRTTDLSEKLLLYANKNVAIITPNNPP